jgi:LysR family transcriptional regulator, glycine cleavage system transcriptional activator
MRKLPPLTELRAFEAAARHLSFKMAAAELGVTPTAVSHQLKLLERHCGQSLFRRHPRRWHSPRRAKSFSPSFAMALKLSPRR